MIMKLLDWLTQQKDLEIIFRNRTYWGSTCQDVYLCKCGELLEFNYGMFEDNRYESCPNCQKEIELPLRFNQQVVMLNLNSRTIFEKVKIRRVSETCVAMDCLRAEISVGDTDRSLSTLKQVMDQSFECYETIYHHLDGTIEFEHEHSEFTSTAIHLNDVHWQVKRSSNQKNVSVKSSGCQVFEGTNHYYATSNRDMMYLGQVFATPTNGTSDILQLFTVEKEPGIENHPVWRRQAFYHIDFDRHIHSIAQLVHVLYYLNRLVEQYPIFEQLVKGGYHGIVTDWVEKFFINPDKHYQVYKYLNKHTKESKIIGLPTYMRRYLKEQRASYETYQKWVQIQHEQPLTEELFEDYLAIEEQLDLKRVWRLIQKQQLTLSEIIQYVQHCEARQAIPMNEALKLWDEALAWSTKYDIPMKKFPNSVKLAYDRAKLAHQEKAQNKRARLYAEQAKNYATWGFKDEALGYLIDVPQTLAELERECQAVNCYLEYFLSDILNGKGIVLTMRSLNDLNQPLYLINWSIQTHTIRNVRGIEANGVNDWNALKFLKKIEQIMA